MYMQQKAELEDEERRRHELEAKERRYEIAGDAVHEMPAMTDGRVLRGKIQELKGEEFSRELQAQ